MSVYTNKIESLSNKIVIYDETNSTTQQNLALITDRWQTTNDSGTGDVVNDNPYATGTFRFNYDVWDLQTIDSTGNIGNYNSMASINGKPAIAYYDTTNANLKFTINSVADGSGSWSIYTVDSTGDVGVRPCLCQVNGKPAISYYDVTNSDLKYTINSLADGSGSWSTQTVDSTGQVGDYSSLVVVDGTPAIAYHDITNGDLKFTRNAAVDGSGAWTTQTVYSTNDAGRSPSMTTVNGRPAIAFYRLDAGSSAELFYTINSLANGSGTWTTTFLDTPAPRAGADNYTDNVSVCLKVIDGYPSAACPEDDGGDTLYYLRNSAIDGLGTWDYVTVNFVAVASGAISCISMTTLYGFPVISYVFGAEKLYFAVSTAVNGLSTWVVYAIHNTVPDIEASSLVVIDNKPLISIYDNGNLGIRDLRFISSLTITSSPSFQYNFSSQDSYYNNWWIKVTNDVPTGIQDEVRQITAYTGATRQPTFSSSWTAGNPTRSTTFAIYPSLQLVSHWDETNEIFRITGYNKNNETAGHGYLQHLNVVTNSVTCECLQILNGITLTDYNDYTVLAGKSNSFVLGTASNTHSQVLIKDLPLYAVTTYIIPTLTVFAAQLAGGDIVVVNGATYTFDTTANIATHFGISSSSFSPSSNVITFRVLASLINGFSESASFILGTGQSWTNRTAASTVVITGGCEFVFKFTSATAIRITVLA